MGLLPKEKIEFNDEFRQALGIMQDTGDHAFITGRAGTGKSTLLEYFRGITGKKIAVLAPTGVAAVNVRGQTIHSFFKFKPDITLMKVRKLSQKARRLYENLDSIVIDEVSMVRADLLDCVDKFLRLNSGNEREPFGGIQMILIGDLQQLAPIVSSQDKAMLASGYESPYFFQAKAFKQIRPEFVELEKIYRQKDERFIQLLNAIRNNTATEKDFKLLNSRCSPGFQPSEDSPCVTLTPTNKAAEEINASRLEQLPGKKFSYQGVVKGDFNPNNLPTSLELELKEGARAMLLNNDSAGRWVNGTMVGIKRIQSNCDGDVIEAGFDDGSSVQVTPYTWDQFEYSFNPHTNSIDSESIGSFTQYPLKLAWAVTIHKSQGKTFDNVFLDIGNGTFAPGQVYVALSRCRTLEGIALKKAVEKKHVFTDWRAAKFVSQCHYDKSEEKTPLERKMETLRNAAESQMSLEVVYLKQDGTKSRRVIQPKSVGEMEFKGRRYLGVTAYCFTRQDERNFRVDRILEINEQPGGAKTRGQSAGARTREASA